MEDRAMRSPTRSRRPSRSIVVLLSLTITLGALAAACGSAASSPQAATAGAAGAPAPAASFAPADDGTTDRSKGGGAGNGSGGGGGDVALFNDAKIVRTGSLQLTVPDVGKALTSARDAIRSVGGYIGGSQQEQTG
jgi:hypothetical protein